MQPVVIFQNYSKLNKKIMQIIFYFKEKQYLCGPKWTITPNIVYQTSKKNNNNKIIYRNEKRYSS